MTTPDRRILALTSILLLLLQVAPASALCTCETPCAPVAASAAAEAAPGSCCREPAAETLPAFEGVCCMAGGAEAEAPTVVALLQAPAPGPEIAAAPVSVAPISPTSSQIETGPSPRARSAPPSSPPIFLLTVSFLN